MINKRKEEKIQALKDCINDYKSFIKDTEGIEIEDTGEMANFLSDIDFSDEWCGLAYYYGYIKGLEY